MEHAKNNFKSSIGDNYLGCAFGSLCMLPMDKFDHKFMITLFNKKINDLKGIRDKSHICLLNLLIMMFSNVKN